MLIQELTRQESLDLLARTRLGRLGCSKGPQPYVVPVYFTYGNHALYSFATLGQKIVWMRANPLVCVEADEVVSQQQWRSVIVFGRYEELSDTPEWQAARAVAQRLLQKSAMWWEPALLSSSTGSPPARAGLLPHSHCSISGHRAIPRSGGVVETDRGIHVPGARGRECIPGPSNPLSQPSAASHPATPRLLVLFNGGGKGRTRPRRCERRAPNC
jgi:nitroimidazol reductase NimA-like FMN-containing flavoprotein (pyridoxamine 5'-phosphate oxidase superfamily)